jgi:hypothetical protein
MEFTRKCPICGLDLAGIQGELCPICAARIPPQAKRRVWLGALIQFVIMAAFILLFRLPKFLIVFFGLFSLFVTLFASVLTRKGISARPRPQTSLPKSAGFQIVSFAIALFGFVFLCCLLFGFVAFINSWNSWQRYEGQPFHRAEFVVDHDYYQRNSKSVDLYASGTVEGHREWMDLETYLRAQNFSRPRGQGELELQVPVGTSIRIYFFPNLKSRSRVRLYSSTAPADAYRQSAMNALRYGLAGIAVCGLAIFVLVKIRDGYLQQSATETSLEMQASR